MAFNLNIWSYAVALWHVSKPLSVLKLDSWIFQYVFSEPFSIFLALLDCVSRAIDVARASVVRKMRFSETVKGINAKSHGKVAIHHISRWFFKNFGFFNFNDFFSFSLTWNPMGVKFKNATPPTVVILFQPNFF